MECESTVMDLDYRFWQATSIAKIIEHACSPDSFWEAIDQAKRLDTVMDRDDSTGWYKEVIENLGQDTIT